LPFISNGCKVCSTPIRENKNPSCDVCVKYIHNQSLLDETKSLFLYKNHGKELVIKMKKSNDQYLYNSLAKIGFNIYADFFQNIDLIIPIPIHWLTKFLRGFNQSALLSEELSNLSKITLKKNILIKKKYTKKQSTQLYKNRFLNIKDSFLIKNNDIIKNKNILLIDDVMTTGATGNECAKLLKKNNAKLVKLFTISRTVLSENNNDY
jgi:ComF family protein